MKLDLKTTEVAYYKVLEIVLPNDLPELYYDEEGYHILRHSVEATYSIKYQVGRLIMVIKSEDLVEQVRGKILDYVKSGFIIREIGDE